MLEYLYVNNYIMAIKSSETILESKIELLEVKITNFLKYNISSVKTEKLIEKKERYEQQLAVLNQS